MKKVSYSFSFVDSPGVMSSRSAGKQSKLGQLLEAALSGNVRQIKKLGKELDNGKGIREAIASVRDSEGHSVLHAAASKGRTNVFKYLIEDLKLNVDEKDNNDCTPLLHATLEGHFSTVEYLIDNGADPAALNIHNITALHFATTEGHIEMMRLLLSKGVDVNAPSDIGTPLQLAAEFCKQDVFKVLLDHGASPNPVDSVTPTALDLCISRRSLECAKLLLQAGADPNAVSCGATPLASAAREGEIEFVKCLLKAGADPNIENDVGMKPIEIAAEKGNRREVGHLFPVTSPIPSCSDWSIGGIMKYVQSEEANEQIKLRVKEKNLKAKSEGDNSLKRKDYMRALFSYTEAIAADPSDATALSSRSCCFACIGDGSNAWADAKACTRLRPDWPEAHYRAGVALGLLEKFDMAADSFLLGVKLDPKDNGLRDAFRKAVDAKMNSIRV